MAGRVVCAAKDVRAPWLEALMNDAEMDVVAVAQDGRQAVEWTALYRPGIVIVEAALPYWDGFEVARRVRLLPLERGVEVAVLVPPGGFKAFCEGTKVFEVGTALAEAQKVHAWAQAKGTQPRTWDASHEMLVHEHLEQLGLSAGLKGFGYLKEAILLKSRAGVESGFSIYEHIAKVHGAQKKAVERCMRHTIERAWLEGNLEAQLAAFGDTVAPSRGKPTASEVIARLAEVLRLSKAG